MLIKLIIRLTLLSFLIVTSHTSAFSQLLIDSQKDSLKKIACEMDRTDQSCRDALRYARNANDSTALYNAIKAVDSTDSANIKQLVPILKDYGFPNLDHL